ncbi:MAG: tyrosine-type recombinase/integrase [Pseudomonadota bacterium]|nr:tyrosine-type recombinase/integrase [Pseudomonadota bacterium]
MSAPPTMQAMVCNYLAERRRLGFELISCGRLLMSFARHVDAQEHGGPLTVEIMAQWAKQDKWQRGDPATWARRLKQLRPFTRYLRQFEPCTEVPDESIFGPIQERLTPHIYSAQEIVDLLAAARALRPPNGLRPATYETLFGLIAAAGLRLSEAVHLLEADVELKRGLLRVRKTKFAKSRQLPLHPSTVDALRRYRNKRSHHVAVTPEMPFFVSSKGKGLSPRQVERVFAALRQQLGWVSRGGHTQPRIQDLRHTFAVQRVTLWQTRGVEIDQAMLALSTYMGHAKISNTYWYLTAVPELMAAASGKFEQFARRPEVEDA